MQLAAQEWLQAPSTQQLLAAFGEVPLRFVGGCVRDALLGRPVGDIDCATPLLPEATMALLKEHDIKAVPTGLAHGTITAVIDGKPFEITTLRRDVSCDGRRAVVAFSKDWQEDAARRDFTMNALYCDARGNLYDYHNGIADAKAGYVRFIGDASARIGEDALRILRFFRFYATHGQGAPDSAAMAACTQHRDLLKTLSAERVQHELLKLLAAPDPRAALSAMHESGVLKTLLPECRGKDAPYSSHPHPLLRLALMLGAPSAAQAVAARLKLSNQDRDLLLMLAAHPNEAWPDTDVEILQVARHLSPEHYALLLRRNAAWLGLSDAQCEEKLAHVARLSIPSFPVRGQDLIARGMPAGSLIGETLAQLERDWEASDYRLSKEELLAKL